MHLIVDGQMRDFVPFCQVQNATEYVLVAIAVSFRCPKYKVIFDWAQRDEEAIGDSIGQKQNEELVVGESYAVIDPAEKKVLLYTHTQQSWWRMNSYLVLTRDSDGPSLKCSHYKLSSGGPYRVLCDSTQNSTWNKQFDFIGKFLEFIYYVLLTWLLLE